MSADELRAELRLAARTLDVAAERLEDLAAAVPLPVEWEAMEDGALPSSLPVEARAAAELAAPAVRELAAGLRAAANVTDEDLAGAWWRRIVTMTPTEETA